MWDWIAKIERIGSPGAVAPNLTLVSFDPAKLQEWVAEAQDSLANPFTTRWGIEHMEYQLHDAKQRLSELAQRSIIDTQQEMA